MDSQIEKQKKEATKENRKFPLTDFGLFIGSAIAVGAISVWYESLNTSFEIEEGGFFFAIVLSAILITIVASFSAGFQFLLTRYPAGWIARQKKMYTYDMWQAIFYSSMIVLWLGLVTEPLGLVSETTHSVISNVISTVSFILFYFNGEKKEPKVKRAVLIISLVWLALNVFLVYFAGTLPEPAV